MASYTAHIGHDNPVSWFLKAVGVDGVEAIRDASDFDRFVLELDDGDSFDSAVEGLSAGNVFDNTQTLRTEDGGTAVAIRVRVGLLTGITPGRKKARLVCFDTDHPNGLVWGKQIKIEVIA
jgi:hypothetical protein